MNIKNIFIFSTIFFVFILLQSFGKENPIIVAQIQLAQENLFSKKDSNDIFVPIEKFPEFPGGMEKLHKYLQKTLKYPEWEKKNKIQGKVKVGFVVEKDGSLTNIEILETVTDSKNIDKEAIRLINNMPKWIPAKLKEKPVRCRFILPIMFKL